ESDEGEADKEKEFAKHSKIDALVLKKSRDRTTGEVKVDEKLDIDVSGRDALLVDDMISSGGSIVKAAEVLHNKGAGKVYAMCAHALLLGDAARNLMQASEPDMI